jgi:hypothetical protein
MFLLTKLLQKKEAPRVDADVEGEVTGKAGGTPDPRPDLEAMSSQDQL